MTQKYIPTKWVANETIGTANVMNNIEQGIVGVYDEIERVDSQFAHMEKKEVNVLNFGAKGDGVTDDTLAIQEAINFSLNSIYDGSKYPKGYKTKVIFPSGRYKITSKITSYPQICLVSEGFVQFESYVIDDSCIQIKYPIDKTHDLQYVGDVINGSNGGFYINNMLVDYNKATSDEWNNANWGGNNIGLEIGNRISEIDYTSDTRLVARYGISNVYINNFKIGMRLNHINHFMGHYRQVRIALSDICVLVGEVEGYKSDLGIENFSWISCMFERSNTVMKTIRSGIGHVFDKCSFDFIRQNSFINTVSGIPRLYFNGCWIEKLRGLFFEHTQSSEYASIGNNLYFKGCHILLPFKRLFKTINNKTSITFDDCVWLRDTYYEDLDTNSNTKHYSADNRYLGCENTIINNVSITVYEKKGLPLISENYNSIVDGGFKKVLDTINLKQKDVILPIWFESVSYTGVANGIVEISDISSKISGCSYEKSIKIKPSPSSTYTNLVINTNKIKVNKNKKLNCGVFVKASDYNKISFVITFDFYDVNDNKIDTVLVNRDYNGSPIGSFITNEWNVLHFIPKSMGDYLIPHNATEYIKMSIRCNNSNDSVTEEITGFYIEEI